MTEDKREEYDLKGSEKVVGQLYPILRAKDGSIIDGLHRERSDPAWKTVVLENIDSEEKKLAARLIANFHRREISGQEKAEWINGLAQLYKTQGLKTEGSRGKAQGPNEIVERICETTGINYRVIMEYLDPSFKQQGHRRLDPEQHNTRSPPDQIIFNALAGRNPAWARSVIDRLREEHEKELLESPLFRKKVLDMIPKSLSNPVRPAIVFDPLKDEQVQELMRLKEKDVFPEHKHRPSVGHSPYRRKDPEAHEGYEPVGQLYPVFIQECPQCLCSKCKHGDVCIERVRPED